MLDSKALSVPAMLHFERILWRKGVNLVAGIDEAGRGPLAGPVVAAAVIFPPEVVVEGVDDSKKLSPRTRESLLQKIKEYAVAVGVGMADEEEIDSINILRATHNAMRRAVGSLSVRPKHLLIDGRGLPEKFLPQTPIYSGDARSHSIAAASIIAKVTRDRIMIDYDAIYPEYGFARHKGYGTAAHFASLATHGPCPIHRMTFRPVRMYALDPKRMTGKEVGRWGELLAAKVLYKAGYTIRARNYRAGRLGEIDIVAENDDTLIFAEVKATSDGAFGEPIERVDAGKQAQIGLIAEAYLQEVGNTSKNCRFDVIAIDLSREKPAINHLENAFWLST